VKTFLGMLDCHAKRNRLLTNQDFQFDHPIERLGRCLLVALLKHLSLLEIVYSLVEGGKYFGRFGGVKLANGR